MGQDGVTGSSESYPCSRIIRGIDSAPASSLKNGYLVDTGRMRELGDVLDVILDSTR
jgi:hypothetical protein